MINEIKAQVKGLSQTADYLEMRLRELGCDIERYEDDTYGPTLVGRRKGRGKATILLYAHMDTVWPEGTCAKRLFSWNHRIFICNEGAEFVGF